MIRRDRQADCGGTTYDSGPPAGCFGPGEWLEACVRWIPRPASAIGSVGEVILDPTLPCGAYRRLGSGPFGRRGLHGRLSQKESSGESFDVAGTLAPGAATTGTGPHGSKAARTGR